MRIQTALALTVVSLIFHPCLMAQSEQTGRANTKSFSKNGLSIKAVIEPAEAAAGDEVELVLSFRVPRGKHLYGSSDQTYPTKVTIEDKQDFTPGELVIPKGTYHRKKTGGTNYWLTGKQQIRQKLTLSRSAAGKIGVAGEFDFMICSEQSCRPPAKIAFTTTVQVASKDEGNANLKTKAKTISIGGREFSPAVRLQAAGEVISVEDPGYACPSMADFDGDGRKDLLVGQFSGGKVKVYKNLGNGNFAAGQWVMAAGSVAEVPGVW